MSIRPRLSACIGLLGLLVLCPQASALEPLSARDFVAACKAYREGGHPIPGATCRAFLQGFLAAVPAAVAEESRPSPFVQRALRTRGVRLSEETEQRLHSPYCLPHDEPLDTLVNRVAGADYDLPGGADASMVMRKLLENFYRCDREL